MRRLAGLFSPRAREAVEVLYQFERPFIMDASKFEHTFGATVTPHREAVRQIVQSAQA